LNWLVDFGSRSKVAATTLSVANNTLYLIESLDPSLSWPTTLFEQRGVFIKMLYNNSRFKAEYRPPEKDCTNYT